jgi:hypothetical protein
MLFLIFVVINSSLWTSLIYIYQISNQITLLEAMNKYILTLDQIEKDNIIFKISHNYLISFYYYKEKIKTKLLLCYQKLKKKEGNGLCSGEKE